MNLKMPAAGVQYFSRCQLTAQTHDDVTGRKAAILDLHEVRITQCPGTRQVERGKVEFNLPSTGDSYVPFSDDEIWVRIWEVWTRYASLVGNTLQRDWNDVSPCCEKGKNKKQLQTVS